MEKGEKQALVSSQITMTVFALALTVLSGLGDSQGFIHAAKVWQGDRVIWGEVALSALGFGAGILIYWIAIKFFNQLGVVSPELQTLTWFAITIVGVAVFSGKFVQFRLFDQLIALAVLAGLVWLLVRNSG